MNGQHHEIACVVATKPNRCAVCDGYIAAGEQVQFEPPRTVKHVACGLAERRKCAR